MQLSPVTTEKNEPQPGNSRWLPYRRAAFFLLGKLAMILLTIFAGVFLTVLIVSRSGQLEKNARSQIERYINQYRFDPAYASTQTDPNWIDAMRANLEEEAGLNLPFWPRQLRWTMNALLLDWGKALDTSSNMVYASMRSNLTTRGLILDYLPNTLLLVGSANLLIFVLGIPLALYLSSRYGNWLDRLISLLVPLSSIPGWVHGVLLISLFAVELRLLPVGGMLDTRPPDNPLGYLPIVARHMLLPVTAIFLNLFFQLVYNWRTYFLIYREEDYVDLGRAKGLEVADLERQYILRPSLPYIITGFALSLVGFWQTVMVLEVVFDWPGIGWLYIKKALPNYWGEAMYPGDLVIAIGIVVIFAYLLGSLVFLLDLVYAWVDPRIRLGESGGSLALVKSRSWGDGWHGWFSLRGSWAGWNPLSIFQNLQDAWRVLVESLQGDTRAAWLELRRSPLALLGMGLITLLVFGSLYAVVFMPYEKIGSSWGREAMTGRSDIPKMARPAWLNLFRQDKQLSTLLILPGDERLKRSEQLFENGTRIVTLDFQFDYPYAEPPSELNLYLQPEFQKKRPFIYLVWQTPDGRQIDLRGTSFMEEKSYRYDFEQIIPYKQMVSQNPHLQKWFELGLVNPTPAHTLLFNDPQQDRLVLVRGRYHLLVNAMFFEKEGDLRADLVMLGQVYGLAGTDYLRRNLLVPLLWGLPFALLFGLLGSLVTTILSMLVAAGGVWFGGWVDGLIQRLTEANMIMPVLAISVLVHWLFGISIWVILAVVVLLNIFGSPTKTFRSAFLQLREAPYIEAAQAYGASNQRMIVFYMMPRIIPVLVPQLVTLIPSFVFLEATLGMFNIKSDYPTWGVVIYQALVRGALWGSPYWVLEPLGMLLLTGTAFAMLGYALERILNPRLREKL
jgi:peptide/nickel transport system permease protein